MAAAVITPTPDFFNMALMGGPLYLLFEIGIILAKIVERRRAVTALSI
jgi:sec-independent protein translocase protein TatC